MGKILKEKPCGFSETCFGTFFCKEFWLAFLISFGCDFAILMMDAEEYAIIVMPVIVALVGAFFCCFCKNGKMNNVLLRFAFLLISLLSCLTFSIGCTALGCRYAFQKSPLPLMAGIIVYCLFKSVVNQIKSCRKKSCLVKIVAWNKNRGIEEEFSPITADDGETYCIVNLDDGKQIAVNVNCRPDKRGYYKCAWIWNDPKDGQCRFIMPKNYQVLFNPETGDFKTTEKVS